MLFLRRARVWSVVVLGLLSASLAACKNSEDTQKRVNDAEARAYANAATRQGDEGAREQESAAAKELVRLYEARESALSEIKLYQDDVNADAGPPATLTEKRRLLGVGRDHLTLANDKIAIQTKLVEANRDKLVQLKKDTEAQLRAPNADAALLRDRLSGVETSLAESTAALAGAVDAG